MKVVKILAIIFTVILAAVFIAPVFISSTFNVSRSATINAKPNVVFGEVNGFKKWETWSPWLQRDSTIKNTYSGPESGVGNKVSWTSEKSGTGSMEVVQIEPDKAIQNKITFGDFPPFTAQLTFEPEGEATKVTWSANGNLSYMARWMSLMADKMMGPDYEKGLSNLKSHVESLAAPTSMTTDSSARK
jgi:carbon monoxide dehydrogenase subunit G